LIAFTLYRLSFFKLPHSMKGIKFFNSSGQINLRLSISFITAIPFFSKSNNNFSSPSFSPIFV